MLNNALDHLTPFHHSLAWIHEGWPDGKEDSCNKYLKNTDTQQGAWKIQPYVKSQILQI